MKGCELSERPHREPSGEKKTALRSLRSCQVCRAECRFFLPFGIRWVATRAKSRFLLPYGIRGSLLGRLAVQEGVAGEEMCGG